jgi:hypothetical protein
MKMKSKSVFILTIVVTMLAASPVLGVIIDSINADKTPYTSEIGNVGEIGWVYTPEFSYILTGIQSQFGDGSGPTYDWGNVELEVYEGIPISGGVLLRSVTISVITNQPGGGSFEPLEVSAGSDYFIGFRSLVEPVGGFYSMSCNFADSGVPLPCYYGTNNDGTYPNTSDSRIYPILQFEGVPRAGHDMSAWFGFAGAAAEETHGFYIVIIIINDVKTEYKLVFIFFSSLGLARLDTVPMGIKQTQHESNRGCFMP